MNILLTGGAGFIGSHTCVELITAGHTVVVVDNLVTSSRNSLDRVTQITGCFVKFYDVDATDKTAMRTVFEENSFDAVIHFAGLKAVGESVEKPLSYYRTNIDSALTVLELMQEFTVNHFVFSSSATVYGEPKEIPIFENADLQTSSPYGRTKLMIEEIARDVANASSIKVSLLRYFNPVGAHKSGLLGEDPKGHPNNLMPYIIEVAKGKRSHLSVFGDDYDTIDGTGVRDYIHVVDLAKGHVSAVEQLAKSEQTVQVFNLGTGKGLSVLEVIRAFEKASGISIPFKIVARRAGDVPKVCASCDHAKKELGWSATRTIDDMCVDTWRWVSQNPNGLE